MYSPIRSPIRSAIRSAFDRRIGGAGFAGITLVAHGDSITSSTHPTEDPTKNWSRQLAAAITARTGQAVNLIQRGIGGHSWNYAWPSSGNPNTLIQDAVTQVDPYVSATAKLAIFAGTNGLQLNGRTPAQEAADADTYIVARLSAGWVASNIYVLTMLPRENYSNAKRTEYCLALETICQTRGCNIVRLHEDFDIGTATQQQNTTWYGDQIHPTPAGHEVIAECVYDIIYTPAWTPSLLASAGRATLTVHLDAQDATTLFTDAGVTQAATNDLVYQWNDKSGGGFNAVQATSTARGSKKTYLSKPSIQFGGFGSGDFMQSATVSSGLPAANYTLFCASASDVTGGNHQLFASSPDNSSDDLGASIRNQNGWLFRNKGVQQATCPNWTAPYTWTTTSISAGAIAGHALVNGGRGVIGGVNVSTTAQAQGYRVAAPYSVTGFQLGGYMGEIVWFTGQMRNVDMRRVEKYLADKWTGNTRPTVATFTPLTGQTAGATVTSNTVTVAGLGSGTAIRLTATNRDGFVAGLEYSINGGAWTTASTAGRLVNGDTVQLRCVASSTSGQTREQEIHFGSLWLYWTVTTA